MAKLTRDQWLVYAAFRAYGSREKAEEYKRRAKTRNNRYGIKTSENPWALVKADYDRRIIKRFIPRKMTVAECQEMTDEIWIDCPNSLYDCTGAIFTTGVDFYEVPGGMWVYHFLSLDV